jgi:hypothetical protein
MYNGSPKIKFFVVASAFLSFVICSDASACVPKKKHIKFTETAFDIASDEMELTKEELLLLDLHMLIEKGYVGKIEKIAKTKKDFFTANVNKPIQDTNRTMLMDLLGTHFDDVDIIKMANFLIKNGALLDCEDSGAETCLHLAVRNRSITVTLYILYKFYEQIFQEEHSPKAVQKRFKRFLAKKNNNNETAYDLAIKKWPQDEYSSKFVKDLEILNGDNQDSFNLFQREYKHIERMITLSDRDFTENVM